MELNYFGISYYLAMILVSLLVKKVRLIDLFLFSIPFNSTAVFFIRDTPVSLPFLMFASSFLNYLIGVLFKGKIFIPKNSKVSVQWIFLLMVIVVLSEVMPYILDGRYEVLDRYGSLVMYAKNIVLSPSVQWITQMIYFVIGLLVSFLIVVTYTSYYDIRVMLKFFLAGVSFMVVWGWFEYLCFFTGIEYPYYLFDHIGMSRFGTLTLGSWPRMVSVTMEASYLAQILTPAIPFFYWFSRSTSSSILKINKNTYYLSVITLIVAYTSTGVIGFFLHIGLLLKNTFHKFSKTVKVIIVLVSSILSVAIVILGVMYIIRLSGTYSGIERLKTITLGINYFMDYPILGVGWGVFPTFDFLVNLLVNFGLLGTIPFLILIYNIIKRFSRKIGTGSDVFLYKAGLQSFILILIVSELSGFIYHSQYFWVYLGIAITISSLKEKNNEIFNNNTNN